MTGEEEDIFLVVSGEHPTLPKAEVRAILEAEGISYRLIHDDVQLLRILAGREALRAIPLRAAYLRRLCRTLFLCEAKEERISEAVDDVDFNSFLSSGETFAVRVIRVGLSARLNISALERKIGGVIFAQTRRRGCRVNLTSPGRKFVGVVFGESFAFGLELAEAGKELSTRKPAAKPFSHPATLQPKLARCMVNLSRIGGEGAALLDPFCGTGTILLEACLMGFEAVGCDILKRMAGGALVNLRHFNAPSRLYHVLVADASRLPITQAAAVVTDPPYGRSSTTLGRGARKVILDVLHEIRGVLDKKRGVLVMASPFGTEAASLGLDAGFRLVESHRVVVHRSLTREIAVMSSP